jgi:CHAT domain-containing protein/tetratricopeptide (TPR) repeat protein
MSIRRRVALPLLCLAWLAGFVPPARAQQPAQPLALPPMGSDREQSLAPGDANDWQVDLAAADFLVVSVEQVYARAADDYPLITVTGPDAAKVFESTTATIAPQVDRWSRTVVALIADRAGSYRLRVAARASPTRYRLWVDFHRPSIDEDRQRIAAYALWTEGMRLFEEGSQPSLKTAVEKYNGALTILTSIGDDEGQALTLGTLSNIFYNLSDPKQGIVAAQRELEIWKRLGREREESITLSDLGVLSFMGYDHPGARSYYDQALTKQRALGDAASQAQTLTRLGWLHYARAELQSVLDVNHEALALYRQVGNEAGESIVFNDLGRAYNDLGEVTLSLDALKQAFALRPPDRDPRGAANVLIRMAIHYSAISESQQQLDALLQARALAQQAHDQRTEITALTNLGSAYVTFADVTEGVRYLETALTLARSITFKGAEGYALYWLGIAYSAEPEKSRDYLQQAIAVQTSINDVRGRTLALRHLAIAYLRLGTPQEALGAIQKSIEISPKTSALVYSGTSTLAAVYAALGDTAQAQKYYEEAIEHLHEIRARHAEALALTPYARFQVGQGRYAEARDLLEQALSIHESMRGVIVDPDMRMSYTSQSLGPYRLYIDVLMELDKRSPGAGLAAKAFHTNERGRARGLLDMLAMSGVDVHEGVDQTLLDRERALRWNLNAKAAIQTSLLASKRDEKRLAALDTEISELSRSWRETTTLIRQQSPAYASLTEPQPLTVEEVGTLLDDKTVLLEFAAGEAHSWLFAVTNTSFETFELPSRQAIDITARDVHRLLTARQPVRDETAAERYARISSADTELGRRSRTLSDLVFGPIRDKLANDWAGRRLAIVATGALEYVPFAALPLPSGSNAGANANAKSLIASHEIVTLPSASSLAFLRRERAQRPAAQRMIAVLADPVFTADDPRVKRSPRTAADTAAMGTRSSNIESDIDATAPTDATAATGATTTGTARDALDARGLDGLRGSLARLPFTRAEAIAVASQVPRTSLLQATDFDASLALATSGRLNNYRIVHFATHGLINTTRPELSGLALSLVDTEGRRRDGFLRLNTIYNMRLSADLVVLSACQTALGKELAGEGLVGLTRGFMYAGARRVIASLWQVSDVATAELMKKFYAGMLQRHLPPAAALRQAQLEMSRDPRWSAPYFWAGFVLQGDWQR